jgi:hypothetical protein
MGWEFRTVSVWRVYDNRDRDYYWQTDSGSDATDWPEILSAEARAGWDLVAACIDTYDTSNTSSEAIGYRLFLKRATRASVPG